MILLRHIVIPPLLMIAQLSWSLDDETPLLTRYQELLRQNSYQGPVVNGCVDPKPNLDKRTRKYRTAIGYQFKQAGAVPNFCGKYYLMVTPITGGGDIFMFDCQTGKPTVYSPKYASRTPLMDRSSCTFVLDPPDERLVETDFARRTDDGLYPSPVYGPPRIFAWKKNRFVAVKDQIWPNR